MLLNRRGVLLLGLAGLAACAPISRLRGRSLAPNSRLIIYRHADRTDENLTERGIARAAAFAEALDGIPIDAIYSPGITRNLDTAAPLSEARGIPVQRVAVGDIPHRIARLSAGRSIVWIGNRGNLRAIWDQLGLLDPPPLEYGDLHIVTTDAEGAVTIDRRRVELD